MCLVGDSPPAHQERVYSKRVRIIPHGWSAFIFASPLYFSNRAILSFMISSVVLYRYLICLFCLFVLRFAILSLCLLPPISIFVPFDLLLQSYPALRALLFLFDLVCKQLSRELTVLCSRSGCLTSNDYPRGDVLELDGAGSFVLGTRYTLAGLLTKRITLVLTIPTIFWPPGPLPFRNASSISASLMTRRGGIFAAALLAAILKGFAA